MWLKEQNEKLIPPPENFFDGQRWQMNFPKNEAAMTAAGWRDWTDAEIEAWKTEHPDQPPPEQTVFTKLKIRRAMRELDIEAKLDGLLNASAQFRADWTDAQDIDLTDPVLLSALQSGSISAEEIAEIKRIAGGV